MPITTVNDEVDALRHLSRDYTDLLFALADGPPSLETDGLKWLSARVLDTQDLTRRALQRLYALATSRTADLPEHLHALKNVASIAQDTTAAGLTLASAVTHFPFTATGPGQPPPGEGEPYERARQAIAEKMHDASRTLQSCATACLYAAAPLADYTTDPAPASTPAAQPAPAPAHPPKLTAAQKKALAAIAAGDVTMHDSGQLGNMRITVANGARITMSTYEALRSFGLVDRDTSTSLYSGQKLYATEAGRTALAALPATTALSGRPASAASPPARRH